MRTFRAVATVVAAVALTAPAATALPTAAASRGIEWRASLDDRTPSSYAVIRTFPGGRTFVHLEVGGLAAGATYAVSVRSGPCSGSGTPVVTLPRRVARADGQLVSTQELTAAQRVALTSATARPGSATVRVGSARCGILVRRPLPSAPAHRIGVRTVDGVAAFYDRRTGAPWVPRGANYIRLARQRQPDGTLIVSHSTFNTALYDPVRAEAALGAMEADGYTAVRVWLDGCCVGGLGDRATNSLSAGYLDDFVDFLERARAHRIQVVPTLDWLPGIPRYDDVIARDCCTSFGVANAHFMPAAGLAANQLFFRDLIGGLKARGAALDAIWAWQLRNELYFDADQAPLSLTSGSVTAADGKTYDMAKAGDKRRLMDDSLAWYIDRSRDAIRAVDPTALVTVGFFVPQGPNSARLGDQRVIDTRPAFTSSVDFVDLHAYPGLELTLAQLAENYGMDQIPRTLPVVFGEMGAFRSAYPTASDGAAAMVDWQIGSCALGVAGWLTWTWDTTEDASLFTATGDGGAIASALAPATRPDPCSWGTVPHDLARGRPASATASRATDPPANAVDGLGATKWSAGGFPPQSLSVDLDGPVRIDSVALHVSQYPDGATTHRIYGRDGSGAETLLVTLAGVTHDGEWLTATPPAPGAWTGITAVRVETIESPSWVAWWDVRVTGVPLP